ncbi:hypothetical protein GBAR_LOCUS19675 [Geodia barretti]|uniref:Uncharacterized protein n=1 Tax=Geodia barretti TaxID=519541 RepID=A0AA35SRQ4_GEOBA|nr:hypothetical protein GBAR_LOCUS19675 [Geodia barretti]
MFYGLMGGFQRLQPALQELERSIDLSSDVVVRQQYRTLRRSLSRGISKVIDVFDLLKGILCLKRDRKRWERINIELTTTTDSEDDPGTSVDNETTFRHLLDFEAELKIRVDELNEAQRKVCMACHQIKSDQQEFLAMCGYSYRLPNNEISVASTDLILSSLWIAKFATLSILTFGAWILFLGLMTSANPLMKNILLGFRFQLGVVFLVFLAVCHRLFSRKYRSLESERLRRMEAVRTMNMIISEICNHSEVNSMDRKRVPMSEIRITTDRFFSLTHHEDLFNYSDANRAELQEIMSAL